MNFQEFPWVVNLSLVFTELPLLERPAAAKAAGFDRVEYWWPFGMTGRPERGEIDAFVSAIEQSGIELVAMNLFAGDMPVGERGVLSHPERIEEFRDSVDIAMEVGSRLGTKLFNAPYGHRRPGLDHGEQDSLATENLAYAANAVGRIGGVIMMEPVSGMPEYPVKTAKDAVDIIDRVTAATGDNNLGFLLDQYHITNAGGDVFADIDTYGDRITHVQLADTPHRGEPGSGSGDIRGVITALLDRGYTGAFALEYIPTTTTEESLNTWAGEVATWS